MSLAKLINLLLSNKLYLTRLDLLGDAHEGTYTKQNWLKNPELYQIENAKGVLETQLNQNLRMRQSMYVNCWRIDNHESEAMWKLYCPSNEGVAIQTSYAKLFDSLPERNLKCFIGLVTYLDYETESFDKSNLFNPVMHKRKAFEHEKEIRIVKADMTLWNGDLDKAPAPGINLDTKLISDIEAVYINPYSPEWYFETVSNLLSKIDFTPPIKWSEIKSVPRY